MVFWLHIARTENPDTPKHIQVPPISMNTTQIHPDTPQRPPRHLPAISSEHKILTDDNRHQQTLPDILKQHPSVSWGVSGWLFVSVGVCCHLLASLVPWRCLGGVWRMSGGCPGDIWVVFIGIGGAQMGLIGYLGSFWVLSPCSMEP